MIFFSFIRSRKRKYYVLKINGKIRRYTILNTISWLFSIPGEPEVDYPIFAVAPESSFTCDEKDDGMYADVEARCQVWNLPSFLFLIPINSLFHLNYDDRTEYF